MKKALRKSRDATIHLNQGLTAIAITLSGIEADLAMKAEAWKRDRDFHDMEATRAAIAVADLLIANREGRVESLLFRYNKHRLKVKTTDVFICEFMDLRTRIECVKEVTTKRVLQPC